MYKQMISADVIASEAPAGGTTNGVNDPAPRAESFVPICGCCSSQNLLVGLLRAETNQSGIGIKSTAK